MKLWQKIFLGAFITSVAVFFFCSFVIVVTGLHLNLEDEMRRTAYYQSVYAAKAQEHLLAPEGEKTLFSFLGEYEQELRGDGRYLRVSVNGLPVYDTFRKFPPVPRYTYQEGQAAYTPTYMKDIGDSRYLFTESEFSSGGVDYRFTMIKDLSEIYRSCNMQLNLFFSLCLLQALITATIMFLIARGITTPIERLNEAAKIMAGESFAFQLPVEGEDEISELSTNFNAMAEAIGRSIDDYKRMVGNLTHEIKTPLTSIIGYAELLRDHPCQGEMRDKALDYIISEGKRLHSIARKMIGLSRIQPGLLSIERRTMRPLVETSLMAVGMKAEQKGVRFALEVEPDPFCYVDEELMITMLENVLDNAIKASHDGGRIEVRLQAREGALSAVEITDHGVGISPDDLRLIDQPFYTADKSRSRSEEGLGLGLAICKSVMQHHHGVLRFESVQNSYTRVTMGFPADYYHKLEERGEERGREGQDYFEYAFLQLMN